MPNRIELGLQALIGLENLRDLRLFLHRTARAPISRLLPFTLFMGVVIGASVGIAVGVASGHVGYFLMKEVLNGVVGGLSAPVFLWLGRRIYRHFRAEAPVRSIDNILYVVSGALGGLTMISVQWLLPPLLPYGLWLGFYPVGTAFLFPAVAAVADYVQLQRDEHQQTKALFSRYVSESIAQRIFEERNRITLSGERRQCTVLFSDIRGFTRMVKELGPEEVVQTLNEYFGAMIDIIFKFDGTVNKFIGDAIVVLYGAPVTVGNEAHRAVETAAEMQETLKKMNVERRLAGKAPIRIGIGIDSGPVVVGNIGSTRRLEYTAIGEPVNNAYYLGMIAPAETIYVSENTCRELGDQMPLYPYKCIELKGGTGEIMVYTLESAGHEAPA